MQQEQRSQKCCATCIAGFFTFIYCDCVRAIVHLFLYHLAVLIQCTSRNIRIVHFSYVQSTADNIGVRTESNLSVCTVHIRK